MHYTDNMSLRLRLLMTVFLSLVFPIGVHASYVTYSNTQTIESIPYTGSGFYFSDGQGNSISYTETRNIPVIVSRYPNAVWVYYGHKFLPPNAVVAEYVNGRAAYYCRVEQGRRLLYGRLIPNEGCYVTGMDSKPYLSFQILIR